MNVKDSVGYKPGVDYDPKRVRKGPEFKCFNCSKWFPGSLTYYLSKDWYPSLKYKINFLCGPMCSTKISEKYKEKYVEL
jgi:hypothetical protein